MTRFNEGGRNKGTTFRLLQAGLSPHSLIQTKLSFSAHKNPKSSSIKKAHADNTNIMGDHQDDTGGGGFGNDGFQTLGIMNALKTGDVQTDMIIAMCVPFFLKIVFNWIGKIEDFDIQEWIDYLFGANKESTEYERFICHKTTRTSWGSTTNIDDDTQNSVLLKAIKHYLHKVVKLHLKRANVDLTQLEDRNFDGGYYDYGGYDSDEENCAGEDDDDGDGNYGSRKTLVGTLSRYKVVNQLPSNEWYELGLYGDEKKKKKKRGVVHLCINNSNRKEEEKKEAGNNNSNTSSVEVNDTTFHFRSDVDGAIDDFIETAYKWYIDQLRKLEDHARYYYEMKTPTLRLGGGINRDNGGGGDSSGGTTYKRYKLSEEKTFESLFFREKESLLNIVDHFQRKSGKYSIKGYPHKLGIMLHGPPGTGKTSLIKALAQYTGRSIVNVPLSRVNSNSELMSIFFDRNYQVEGSSVSVKLKFKDVIFVMEDVDAASKIVKRRDGGLGLRRNGNNNNTPTAGEESDEPERIDLPTPKSLFRMFLESSSSDCRELVKKLIEKSDKLKREAESIRGDVLCSVAQRLTSQMPALGLVGCTGGLLDQTTTRVCEDAIQSVNDTMDQRSKLDNILSSHACVIKELLELEEITNDDTIDERFIEELLGEVDCLTAAPTMPPPSAAATTTADSVVEPSQQPQQESETPDLFKILDIGGDALSGSDTNTKKKTTGFGPSLWKDPDQLSLSGLLNVLDGVVDTPGRIIVMTTNHPEMLDPALIRPGRVDKKLLLGHMEAVDIVSMLELYFQGALNDEQVARVEAAVNNVDGDGGRGGLKLTPAQIEQMAVEHDKLEDIIVALEQKNPTTKKKLASKLSTNELQRA